MPIREPIDTNLYNTSAAQRLYRGEIPTTDRMTAARMYTAESAPGVNNDAFDSAGIGEVFFIGDTWHDKTADRVYRLYDHSQGAASWVVTGSEAGLIGTQDTDETDLGDGRVPWYNSSTGNFEYGDRWDDLRFPFQQAVRAALVKPDYDETNIGLLFPEGVTTEYVTMLAQFPHGYKLGSDIYPHIHYIQTAAAVPTFKMEYRWYNIGDTVPAFATIATTTIPAVTAAWTASRHQYLEFPTISGASISMVSSIMDIKVYRDDSVVTGDVLYKEFDIHYQIDSVGSENENTKT